jgi:hypothetical protein
MNWPEECEYLQFDYAEVHGTEDNFQALAPVIMSLTIEE